MNRASAEWLCLALLVLTASSVFGQGTYAARRDGDRLIVFEVPGNVSSGEDSPLDLQDAVNEALRHEIRSLVFEVDKYEFQTRLVIRRSLNITSRPQHSRKTRLSCSEANQIFKIERRRRGQEGITVELRNLAITACTTRDHDGAVHIVSGARVLFADVELVNNTAEGTNHAVVVVDSNATLEVRGGCSFSNNNGRVMLVGNGSEVTIANSTFLHNTAQANGTVLATKPGGGIQLSVRGSRFEGNVAEGSSGGVMWLETSSVTLENGVQFVSNVAGHDGGALFLTNTLGLQISDTLFEKNSCHLGIGGAIFLLPSIGSTTQVRRTIFKRNCANGVMGMGGAIAFKNVGNSGRQELGLSSDVLFLKNTARATGGAVFVNGTNAAIECSASFVNNTAQGEGGGLFISTSAFHVSAMKYSVGSVHEASFVGNSAHVRGGGAMVVHGGAEFSIVNSNCTSNIAEVGGAVFAYDDVRVSIINDTLFRGNRATTNGGSVTVINGREMKLSMCRFEKNSAGAFGGGINIMTTASFNANSSIFMENHAGQGGAMNIESSEIFRGRDTKTTLQEVTFSNNWSLKERSNEGYGGAMRLSGSGLETNLFLCQFENNEARWGGGIYIDKAFETNIQNTSFSSNVANLGGALYVSPLERELRGKDDSTTLESCTFEENEAMRGGALFTCPDRPLSGGIFQLSNSSFEIKNSHFQRNRATEAGGGLYLALINASLTGCAFGNNTANLSDSERTRSSQVALKSSAGGAIYASGGSYLTLSDTNFTSNIAAGRGGAVCIEDALFNCTKSCTFEMNQGRNGGGVFSSMSSRKYESNDPALLHCNECVFERNVAQKGGGVYTSIPKIEPDAQPLQASQRSNNSDRNSTGTSRTAEDCKDLVFLDSRKIQDNNATVTGRDIFSNEPDAIMVATENGNMKLVQYFDTMVNKENNAYTFASLAHTVKSNGSPLRNLNRGNTSREFGKLEFHILDSFDQTVKGSRVVVELWQCPNNSECCSSGTSRENGEDTSSLGVIVASRIATNGTVNFEGLEISDNTNGSSEYPLWACFIDEEDEQVSLAPISLNISFRDCYTMERRNSDNGGCSECDPGQRYVNESGTCTNCPEHATCRALTIIPDNGYWQATSVSHKIYKCHPREACVKEKEEQRELAVTEAHKEGKTLNWTHPQYDQCNTGYEGILCGSCKEDHGRWNDICTECLAIPLMWISLFVSVGWNLLVLLVFIYSARSLVQRARYNQLAISQDLETSSLSPSRIRQIELLLRTPRITDGSPRIGPLQESLQDSLELGTANIKTRRWTPSARSARRRQRFHEMMPYEPLPLTNPLSEALKIAINFMQVVYLAALLSEDLPSFFRWSIVPFDSLNLTETVFLIADCCLLKGNADGAILRMTLQALFPLLLFLLVCLVPALFFLFRKRIKFGLQEVKLVALCTVYLYFGPEIRTLLKFLDGVRVQDEYADLGASHFWSADTSVRFLQGSHAVVVGVIVCPLLIAFAICFPCSLFVSLKKNKDRMQEEDVVSSYGFLYKGYESKYYYWEIVIVIRKTVIAVFSVFAQNAELQSVFISLTLVLFLSLQLTVCPFSSDFPGLNLLESLSLGVSTLLFLGVSLMLRSHVLGNNQLLYAIAWCTLFVVLVTVLGLGVGLFAATQDFLNDKLIEKQLYPDKKSVECLSFTTKLYTLLMYYFQSLLTHLPTRASHQVPTMEVGPDRL